MKKGDVIGQKCVNTTFYLTGILAHKVNNIPTRRLPRLWIPRTINNLQMLSVTFFANSGKWITHSTEQTQ